MNRQYLGTKYRMNVDMHVKSSKSYAKFFNGVTPLYIHCAVPSQVKSAIMTSHLNKTMEYEHFIVVSNSNIT